MQRETFANDGSLVIEKDGRSYMLAGGWKFSDAGTYDFSLKLQDKAFSHGSHATGDGFVKGRTIKLSFDCRCESEQEHDKQVNEAYKAFAQRDYILRLGRSDRYYKVAGISKIKHKYEKGFKQRWSDIEISLLLADPFRYASTATICSKNFDESQEKSEIVIYNNSSVEVPLIFTFKPLQGGSMPDIYLVHKETKENFRMKDTLLTAPAFSVVNGETGTVRREKGNSLNTFSGLFLHANPGRNTYIYSGAGGEISIQFNERWYV